MHEADGSFRIQFRNAGEAGAVFHVRSGHSADAPRSYTIEGGKRLTDSWDLAALDDAAYDLSVHGPNGFFRGFKGAISVRRRTTLDVRSAYEGEGITLEISIGAAAEVTRVNVFDRYTSRNTKVMLWPGTSFSKSWSLKRNSGWYDLAVTVAGDSTFMYQYAGHLENGEASISDPILGGLV